MSPQANVHIHIIYKSRSNHSTITHYTSSRKIMWYILVHFSSAEFDVPRETHCHLHVWLCERDGGENCSCSTVSYICYHEITSKPHSTVSLWSCVSARDTTCVWDNTRMLPATDSPLFLLHTTHKPAISWDVCMRVILFSLYFADTLMNSLLLLDDLNFVQST